MNIGTLTVTLGANTAGLAAATAAMNTFTKNATSSLNTISQRFRTFGYLATATLTYPMVMAGKASLDMAKDFEFSMQKIVGLAGVAQKSVTAWSDEVLKMAPEVAKKPQELAEALYYISSSGIKGAEALDVLKISATAAAAGLGETKEVADLLTSALNAYAGTGLTAAKAADILVAAVREGKGEADAFARTMGQIIPIASNLGVSFDQVAGGMAAITLTGSSAANAAVYLKGVFNALVTASSQGEKALNAMGTSYSQLRKILEEEGLIALMQKLRDLQMKYGDEMIGDVIPNIRAMTGYLSIAGKNFQYNTELMKRVTNSAGSLGVAFAAVSDTIKIKMDRALAAANVSLVTLGKSVAIAFIPVLEWLVKKLDALTKWFDSLTEAQKRHKLITLAIIAALGPLSLLVSVLGYTLSAVVGTVGILTNTWKLLNRQIIITRSLSIAQWFNGVSTAASAAAINTALLATKLTLIGTIIAFATVPIFNALIKKINEYKKEIEEAKKVLGYETPEMELDASIGKRMSVLKTLNQRQLQDLANDIAQRRILEEERLTNAIATGQKEIENEKYVLDQRKELAWKTRDWEREKRLYAQGSTFPQDFKSRGAAYALTIQQINKNIKDYIENRKAEVEYDKFAAQDTIDFYNQQYKTVDKLIEKQKDFNKAVIEGTDKQAESLERYANEWEKAGNTIMQLSNIMDKLPNKNLWWMFTPSKQDLSAISKGYNMLERMPGGGFKVPKYTVPKTKPYEFKPSFVGANAELAEIMKQLGTELDYINTKEQALNQTIGRGRDIYNSTQASVQAYSVALEAMMSLPVGEWTASWYENLEKVLEALTALNLEAKKSQQQTMIYQTIGNAVAAMANQIGGALTGTENALANLVDIVLSAANTIITTLLSEAIAGIIAKEATSKGIWGLISAAVGIGALEAMWQGYKGSMGLAKGGQVPPGYPNDAFRANLTSGETIIPLDRLNEFEPFEKTIRLEVDTIKIKNKDIMIALRRASSMN